MEDWKKRLGSYDSLDEAIFVTIDEETIYTIDKLVDFMEQEISKAREEGIREALEEVLGEMRELEYLRSKGLRNVVDIEEVYQRVENRMIKLDKLKQ